MPMGSSRRLAHAASATVLVTIALVAAVCPRAVSADPPPVGGRLDRARSAGANAGERIRGLEADLERLSLRYLRIERRTGKAAVRMVAALGAERAAQERLAEAERILNERVRAAYQLGPMAPLGLALSADSFSDLVAIREFTVATIEVDAETLEAVTRARDAITAHRRAAERRREPLLEREEQLEALMDRMEADLDGAIGAARKAKLDVRRLNRRKRALEEARERRAERELLAAGSAARIGTGGADQSELLALLGPDGGRGCRIPDGLTDTGRDIAGDASWYGWEFGGQTTASGAVFDPRLFTAAHRTLPFGTFLRVHYGGKCAIVLINDRGPYGNYERVIDLSMAAAKYLGVGVAPVTADILLPR